MRIARIGALGAACLSGPALAQFNTFDIRVSNVISPGQPSATVEVWAVWDPDQYAVATVAFSLMGEADPGDFSDPERMLKMAGTEDGDVAPDGDSVLGIIARQLHFDGGIFADTANPILVWRATWSTLEFTPRSIDLASVTTKFDLYINDAGASDHFLDEFIEGSGVIQVVPAPAPLAVLALLGPGAARRNRRPE
jgi:hypothetical protein